MRFVNKNVRRKSYPQFTKRINKKKLSAVCELWITFNFYSQIGKNITKNVIKKCKLFWT